MANEGNNGRISRMDLNLYLGFPRSPRPSSLADLGSDLALGSLPLPILTTEESTTVADLSGTMEPPDSPSHAPYNPDLPSVEPVHPADDIPSREYTPDEPYGLSGAPVLPIMLELEGSEGPHSPVPALPTVQEDDELQPEGYDPVSPPWPDDRASPQGSEPHVPYSPTYTSFPPTPRMLDEVDFGLYRPLPGRGGEFLSREDWSSSHRDIFRSSTFRLRTLSEVTHQLRHQRQFRMSPAYDGESSNFGRPSSPIAEQLVHDIMSSQRDLGVNRKHEAPAKHFAAEGSDNEMEEKSRNASNFECNICLDMAKEPVVTSCGHLFCWPCLFQWLHIHSDHRECPVCKGEVIESNITPIYGRGSSESSDEKKLEKNEEESGLKIPPRPHGNRFESFRQQIRSFPRRLGEGIATSWRRLMDRRIRNRNNGDLGLLGIYDGGHHPLTRMRARRMQREEGIPESESIAREIGLLPRDGVPIPQSSSSSLLFRDGIDLWRRFSFHSISSERLADMAADLGSVDWRIASSSNQYAASTSSVNPLAPEPTIGRPPVPATLAADQASASTSSTMAVIQEDFSANDISVDPNVAGSSRSHRRRGRSSTSGSLDIDGGTLHARKRRRLD